MDDAADAAEKRIRDERRLQQERFQARWDAIVKQYTVEGHLTQAGVDALLGKRGVVLERIDPVSRQGRVKVDGEDWRGASVDDTPIEVGARITVIQVDGTTLMVEKES